jgi:signal transduction protein with GAF and PtsI domain
MIRVLRTLVRAARRAKKPVSICGEMAGDIVAARLLIGMGYRYLSMVPASIPPMKELIRSVDLKECRRLALAAARMDTAWEIRNMLSEAAGVEG